MKLDRKEAFDVAHKLIMYFNDFKRIDDYFRARKIERVKNIPTPLPGMSMEDDLFQNFDMHPQDMNFKIANNIQKLNSLETFKYFRKLKDNY